MLGFNWFVLVSLKENTSWETQSLVHKTSCDLHSTCKLSVNIDCGDILIVPHTGLMHMVLAKGQLRKLQYRNSPLVLQQLYMWLLGEPGSPLCTA